MIRATILILLHIAFMVGIYISPDAATLFSNLRGGWSQ